MTSSLIQMKPVLRLPPDKSRYRTSDLDTAARPDGTRRVLRFGTKTFRAGLECAAPTALGGASGGDYGGASRWGITSGAVASWWPGRASMMRFFAVLKITGAGRPPLVR